MTKPAGTAAVTHADMDTGMDRPSFPLPRGGPSPQSTTTVPKDTDKDKGTGMDTGMGMGTQSRPTRISGI
jgi:hypothetical protein